MQGGCRDRQPIGRLTCAAWSSSIIVRTAGLTITAASERRWYDLVLDIMQGHTVEPVLK